MKMVRMTKTHHDLHSKQATRQSAPADLQSSLDSEMLLFHNAYSSRHEMSFCYIVLPDTRGKPEDRLQ